MLEKCWDVGKMSENVLWNIHVEVIPTIDYIQIDK